MSKKHKRDLRNQQEKAINAINETAYILLSSLSQMQNSVTSGSGNYLEQLSKMAESQQQINQGSQQWQSRFHAWGTKPKHSRRINEKTSKTTRGIKSTTARNDRRNARWTK